MTFLVLVVFIVYIYYTNNKIKDLQEENQNLKKLIKKVEGLELSTSDNNFSNEKSIKKTNEIQKVKVKKELSEEEKQKILLKKEKEERERKNTTILITGAVLIVVAAIVFLMSTWYTIPNILKTLVLILLIVVFFGGSKIAKEKFKLEKTSNTFFYIAMAYIPICLFSISFFGLFGEFLSLNGEGRNIYLTLVGIITSVVYYITYKQNKSKIVFYGSLLAQLFSVVLFSLIFSNRLELISLNMLLYNILFIILTYNQNNKLIASIKNIYSIIPYISTFLMLLTFENITILIPINLIALATNYAILEAKEKRKSHAYLLNISISTLGIYCIWKNTLVLSESLKMTATLVYFISTYILENMIIIDKKKRELQISSTVINLVLLQLLFFKIYDYEYMILRPYVVSFIQTMICFVSYARSKETGKEITSVLIPIYFIITGFTFLQDFNNASYHHYIIFSLMTFVVGELLQGDKVSKIRDKFFVISNVFIVLTYYMAFIEDGVAFFDDVIYFVLLVAVYVYCYFYKKQSIFKYFAYVAGYISLYSACTFFEISEDFMCLIPTLTLVGLLNLENNFKNLKDEFSNIFFVILKIIAYIYLNILGNSLGTIFVIGLTSYLIYYNYKNKEENKYNIIPLIGAMPSIFDSSLEPTLQICIMLISTVGLTIFSAKGRRINIYTIFSGIYLLFSLEEIDTMFVNEILFIIWALYNWNCMKSKKEKDIFKFLAYLGSLILYNIFAYELEITEYTVFNMLGYIVFAVVVIRDILKKYLDNIDAIEAITFICIYFIAICSYMNEYDGMLFGILIVGIIFVSYVKKYGTLFLVSIAAILLNVFLLTREFWFSIPWWAYLLIIGSLLITFAVRNEVSEKNNKLNLGTTIKKIKDKIEK